MLAKGKTIVAHVDNQCGFCQPIFIQIIKHGTNTFIYSQQGFAIAPVEICKVHCAMKHVIYTMPAFALHLLPIRCAAFAIISFTARWLLFRYFAFNRLIYCLLAFSLTIGGTKGGR